MEEQTSTVIDFWFVREAVYLHNCYVALSYSCTFSLITPPLFCLAYSSYKHTHTHTHQWVQTHCRAAKVNTHSHRMCIWRCWVIWGPKANDTDWRIWGQWHENRQKTQWLIFAFILNRVLSGCRGFMWRPDAFFLFYFTEVISFSEIGADGREENWMKTLWPLGFQ